MSVDVLAARLSAARLLPIHIGRSYWMYIYPVWWWRQWVLLQSREQLNLAQVALFCRTMQSLMAGGLAFFDALRVCAATVNDHGVRQSAADAVTHITHGLSPGEAFSVAGNRWPTAVPLVLTALEGSGSFGELLLYLAIACEREVMHRTDIGRAALLPIITGVGACMILGWALHVCAEQSSAQEHMRVIIAVCQWLWAYGVYVVCALLLSLYSVWKLFGRNAKLNVWRDRMILHLPLMGPLIARAHSILFFTMVALLLRAGIPVVRALEATRPLVANAYWKEVQQIMIEKLRRGCALSDVMHEAPRICIPSLFVASLATVTGAASLAAVCQNTATIVISERSNLINRYATLLPPFLMAIIGVVIIGFLYLLYQTFSASLGALV